MKEEAQTKLVFKLAIDNLENQYKTLSGLEYQRPDETKPKKIIKVSYFLVGLIFNLLIYLKVILF
ncbi:hypothetical protein ACN3E9_12220 [Vibrio pectenicida]|uniref:hypothetical protein n=1 Tax=Vibrio pectenicida TaxID=62763 RepID=UPI003B9B9A4B